MPRMGKTEEDWNGLKLRFLKTVQPNSFSKLISAVCNFKNNAQETYFVCLECLLVSLTSNFVAYFKFHSDWGRVTGKIKRNELDCRDTAPLSPSSNSWPCKSRDLNWLTYECIQRFFSLTTSRAAISWVSRPGHSGTSGSSTSFSWSTACTLIKDKFE